METRVKIYKKYRDQIVREAELNNKLKHKDRDILSLEKKMLKVNIPPEDDLIITSVNSIKPKALNDIKVMNEFCDLVPINDISDDFKSIETNKGIIEHIIDKNGEINKFFLENNDQFLKIKNILIELLNEEELIDPLYINLKDNNNYENNMIHEMKSSSDIQSFLDIKIKNKDYGKRNKFTKYAFFILISLTLAIFILVLVFLFI